MSSKAKRILEMMSESDYGFTLNEMNYDEIMDSAQQSVNLFNSEVYKTFPKSDYTVSAKYYTPSIRYDRKDKDSILFFNFKKIGAEDTEEFDKNVFLNMFFSCMLVKDIQKIRDNTNDYNQNKFEINIIPRNIANRSNHNQKNIEDKFNVIKGKSPLEVTEKLIEWLNKNLEEIDNIPKSEKISRKRYSTFDPDPINQHKW